MVLLRQITDLSHKARNFKCFGHAFQGFDKILPLNVIIGRNNSGKSTLLDMLEFAIAPSEAIAVMGHKRQAPSVEISYRLKDDWVKAVGLSGREHNSAITEILNNCRGQVARVTLNEKGAVDSAWSTTSYMVD